MSIWSLVELFTLICMKGMKVNKVLELKTQYSFEAMLVDASTNKKNKAKLIDRNRSLDLNKYLAPSPDCVYLVKVNGPSMIDQHIFDGDLLVVDRKAEPEDGKVVIASLNGEMAVKTFRKIDGKVYLYSANKNFLPIEIMPFWEFRIQGVVKHVIHKV